MNVSRPKSANGQGAAEQPERPKQHELQKERMRAWRQRGGASGTEIVDPVRAGMWHPDSVDAEPQEGSNKPAAADIYEMDIEDLLGRVRAQARSLAKAKEQEDLAQRAVYLHRVELGRCYLRLRAMVGETMWKELLRPEFRRPAARYMKMAREHYPWMTEAVIKRQRRNAKLDRAKEVAPRDAPVTAAPHPKPRPEVWAETTEGLKLAQRA